MEFEKSKRQKPRVWGLAGIMLIRGLLLGYEYFTTSELINSSMYRDSLPGWIRPFVMLMGFLAVLCLVSAVLIFLYKRYGLMGAIAACAIDLGVGVLILAMGMFPPNVLGFVVSGLILYYSYKYLNEYPYSLSFN
jgi:hypothetical protein